MELLEDRFMPAAGFLDGGFGIGGKVTTDFQGPSVSTGQKTVVQPDGKIVALAVVGDPFFGGSDFALARYNSDGSLDSSFGPHHDGRVITNFFVKDLAANVTLQPDGKIVVVGTSSLGNGDFALARYNANGSLDTGFGPNHDGKVTTNFRTDLGAGASLDAATDVVIQPDGKIVAVGSTVLLDPDTYSYVGDFALARYDTDGNLDTSFGPNQDGKVTTNFDTPIFLNSGAVATGVVLQLDGRIVVAGSIPILDPFTYSSSYDFGLARYDTDGNLDTF